MSIALQTSRSWKKPKPCLQLIQGPQWPKSIQDPLNPSSDPPLSDAFADFSLLRRGPLSSLRRLRLISALIAACSSALRPGEQLHCHVIRLGLLASATLSPRLTSFYIAHGLLSDALAVAGDSPHVLSWNLLISALVKNGSSSESLLAYEKMVSLSVEPDHFTYPSVLKACGDANELDLGIEIHRRIDVSGLRRNLFVSNALVSMYAKFGMLEVAREVFDKMDERDVVSWNSIISGYASKGMWREAFELFDRMRGEGSEVNSVTWNTIVGGKLQTGELAHALELISAMTSSGAEVDFVTLVVGLNVCSRIGSVRLGKEIHGLAVRFSYDKLESVRNALITMYSRCKDIGRAYALFQMPGIRNLITWNTMVAGFALSERAEEVCTTFRDMILSGLRPNYVTVLTTLSLCARVANLQHGRELHGYITKHGLSGYRQLWNSLVDMYSKSGRITVAQRAFDTMSDWDQVSYTSLIAGYGMQGEGLTALRLFDEMIGCGIKPDHITMVAVLSACSHSGLASQGELLFNKMIDSFGIEPRMEHYSCMVDLFGRAGQLAKAEDILNRAPIEPTAAMWAALVGACRVHRNADIGERSARKLLGMKTDNAGHYVLIANMYAAAGCWGELADVRMMMRDSGVRKAPGCAWVDLGTGFRPFLVGDRSSPMAPEIYVLLEVLTQQMCDAGYIRDEDFGFDEEGEG